MGPSGDNNEAFFIADAWVLRRICNEGHLCPFKFFSNGGHREVTTGLGITYPPKHSNHILL